jgi:hypothetical protein
MPNGNSRNLDRLLATLQGFKAKHGHWPTRVRVSKVLIKDLKQTLTTDGYEKLVSKVALITSPTRHFEIHAEDDCGLGFAYGDPTAERGDDADIESWLGSLDCIDDED